MKIERISENQIRCTLNKADLAEKELKISELAYGTKKAKELFREMMQQASVELGFEAADIPLMIEAIPVSPDCLILIVTKVEDPDELDTRFSRFSKRSEIDLDDDDDEDSDEDFYSNNDDNIHLDATINGKPVDPSSVLNAIEGIMNAITDLSPDNLEALKSSAQNEMNATTNHREHEEAPRNVFRIYEFDKMSTIITASKQVSGFYFGENTLYKNPVNNKFYLLIKKDQSSNNEYARLCSILDEYGHKIKASYAMPYHFNEHYKVISQDEAIQTLSAL